ncbi:MAG: hypothetical protein RBR26_15120 [Methanosarcina mazei]|nr:hypothetical protein [Methanosarcina mazei]
MKLTKRQTLYPTLGEVLNEAAALFFSKPLYTDDVKDPDYRVARKIDGLSGFGAFKFEYSSINHCIDRVFCAPFSEEDSDFNLFLKDCGHAIISQYISMIREYPLDGFNRNQIIPWLVENHVCKFICDAIASVQRAHLDKWQGLDLFKDKLPLRSAFVWLEQNFPEYGKFKKDFGKKGNNEWIAIKTERDRIGKWAKGVDIPTNERLWGESGILRSFYDSHEISKEKQVVINEVFFLARALQVFLRRSGHLKAFENLQLMAQNRYIYLSEHVLLQRLYADPTEQVMEKMEVYLCCLENLRGLLVNNPVREKGDREEALRIIELAEKELEAKSPYNPNWWHLSRFRGLWHEFAGETDKAILSYIEAVDGFLYSGGHHARRALREALTLCCSAYLGGLKKVNSTNLKSYIKRLKCQGVLFGFYPPWGLDEEDVPEGEMKIMSGYYWQYFPESKKF